MKDELTAGMVTHMVGIELTKGPCIALHYDDVTIAISDLYAGVEDEVVIICKGINPDHLSWGWDHLFLGPKPGLEAIVYGGFNYGNPVPIIKFIHMNINAIEKTADGFKFRATADKDYCTTGRF